MKKQFFGLILVLLLIVPFPAYAGPPLDTVKGHINKVLDVLSDSSLKGESGKSAKKADIPIHYRVIQKEGEWRVYDIVIEGVSLVNNYRTQFREILASKSPDGLLDILRKKVGRA